MHPRHQVYFTFLFILFVTGIGQTQQEYGGVPTYIDQPSVGEEMNATVSVDLQELLNIGQFKKNNPDNILALPIIKDKKSKETLNNFKSIGSKVFYQKMLLADDAESYLRLSDYRIPRGGRLYVISLENNKTYGAYTSANIRENKNLLIGPIKGSFIVEYNAPHYVQEIPFNIEQIYTGTDNYGAMELGYGTSFDCMINVNCDEGRPFENEKNGVVRIRMVGEEGVAFCTGTLLNNTAEDQTPYVLTAYHCERPGGITFTPLYDMWSFDFSYEGNSCANPDTEPDFVSVQGAEKLSEWEDTDMMLVKIVDPIPISANAYFNGWDRRDDYLPTNTALIHHPNGDVKKVSQDTNFITIDEDFRAWDNGTVTPSASHVRAEFDNSTYQPGSSGAPLFDENGLVLGQLHGGPRSDEFCTIAISYNGRISQSWNAGSTASDRLMEWLDPMNTGVEQLEGLNSDAQTQLVKFIGRVLTADGIAISNVAVSLQGDQEFDFFTGVDGRFVFDNLSTKGNFTFSLGKDVNQGNGLSSIDLILITNHILGKSELSNVFQRLAADVSEDNRISGLDLVQITNVILGKQDSFPNAPSWKFEPATLQMNGSDISGSGVELVVIGFKMGDVNNSANPRR